MMGTLVGWWIYELTNDPLAIGIVGLSEVIPAVSFALYAGHVIDRSEKRFMIIRGAMLYLTCALTLLLLSSYHTANILSSHQLRCAYTLLFLYRYYTRIYRACVCCAGGSNRSKSAFTKCYNMEPGYMAKCIGNWACTRWFVYCFAGYYRHARCYLFSHFRRHFCNAAVKTQTCTKRQQRKENT